MWTTLQDSIFVGIGECETNKKNRTLNELIKNWKIWCNATDSPHQTHERIFVNSLFGWFHLIGEQMCATRTVPTHKKHQIPPFSFLFVYRFRVFFRPKKPLNMFCFFFFFSFFFPPKKRFIMLTAQLDPYLSVFWYVYAL